MRNSWRNFFRRFAAACAVTGSAAWSSAMCYAQIAADFATDPVYADGWQAADNGGSGFTAWNFDGTYDSTVQQDVDTAPFDTSNDIGAAWKLFNPVVAGEQRDIARAGRGFAPLQVGQTFRTIVDTPNTQPFFRGYFVRFNSRNGEAGGGNICYGGAACTPGTSPVPKLNLRVFEYFTYGQWGVAAGSVDNDITPPLDDGFTNIDLFDTDTDGGVQVDMTLTGTETFSVVMTPLGNPAMAVTQTGTLDNPGEPIDWIEFTMFNSQSDVNLATDFYIKSIEILGAAPPGVAGDYNDNGAVDAADYVLWRNGGPLLNEVADPGTVGAADYTEWRARFGNTSGTGAGSGLVAGAVPEPSTFVYLVAGIGGLLAFGLGSTRGRGNVGATENR